MALPGILQKPITAYRDHQYKQKLARQALTNPNSLVQVLTSIKEGSTLTVKDWGRDRRLGSGKRNWVEKYLNPHGGKRGAAHMLREFANDQQDSNQNSIAKQAAKELVELLPKKGALCDQTVQNSKKLLDLARQIAHPESYGRELTIETPAPTIPASESTVNEQPSAETPASDPFEATRTQLLERQALQEKDPSSMKGLPRHADVVFAVATVAEKDRGRPVAGIPKYTAAQYADELINLLVPLQSPNRAEAISELIGHSSLLALVNSGVARELTERHRIALDTISETKKLEDFQRDMDGVDDYMKSITANSSAPL